MKKISPDRLVPMDIFLGHEPIAIDIVYANANHPRNIFREALYHPQARLWTEYDMARIIIYVARKIHKTMNGILELKDCLRTYDAQGAMQETRIVKDHPEWMIGENRLLSPSGHGAHPRGMAIDVCVLDNQGNTIDMGTVFDEMTDQSARNYKDFSDEIVSNRITLENAFLDSAKELNLNILPLPSEWWDFRFPSEVYGDYAPLHDSDLPPQMRMVSTNGPDIPNFPEAHFETLKKNILAGLN